jgi:hypothetical protein
MARQQEKIMMVRNARGVAAFAVSLLFFLAGQAYAQGAGTVTHLAGILSAEKADGQKKLLGVQSTVAPGDLLTTEADTYARIKFVDGAELVLRPGSQMRIEEYRYAADAPQKGSAIVSFLRGGFRAITGLIGKARPENVTVRTPTATIGIRGTHLGGQICQNDCRDMRNAAGQQLENGLHIDVVEGLIVLSNAAGAIPVGAGQFGFVRDLNTPPQILPPGQGFQVGVPPGISRNSNAGKGIGKDQDPDCVAQ